MKTAKLKSSNCDFVCQGTAFMGVHVPSFACLGTQEQMEEFLCHVKSGA